MGSFITQGIILIFLLTFVSISKSTYRSTSSSSSSWSSSDSSTEYEKPNIVVIMADDLGFNDISAHGSDQILTPNIDALGLNGIILNRHYVPPMCTPSRSAAMTGKYPFRLGMQHFVIPSDEPWGLGTDQKIIPQFLKEGGYTTHYVGKWHLGMSKRAYNPMQRGFDSFFGYLGPYIDYWDHSLIMLNREYARGYDMRKNEKTHYETNGTYATTLFTDVAVEKILNHDGENPMFLMISHLAPHTANEDDPMQAPKEEIDKFNYIQNPKRRIYAAMISMLDQSVGNIVEALDENDMLDNTVILFYSDNGAPTIGQHANSGSNHPLKGQKDSPWEGAVRGAAMIFSPLLKKRHRVSYQYVHVTDWLPTFARLANVDIQDYNLDGVDVWDALSENLPSPRNEIVHNIDDNPTYASYTQGRYKFVEGTRNSVYDTWLGRIPLDYPETSNNTDYVQAIQNSDVGRALAKYVLHSTNKHTSWQNHCWSNDAGLSPDIILSMRQKATLTCNGKETTDPQYECKPLVSACLFDIVDDPCEYKNLANLPSYQTLVKQMKENVLQHKSRAVPPRNKPADPNCDPALHGYRWTWWEDEINVAKQVIVQ